MTIAPPPPSLDFWTYERYMATPIEGRFEIIEGALHQMASPIWTHQIGVINLAFEFMVYQRAKKNGQTMIAPSDILIRRFPRLRTRQPDLFYVSLEQLAKTGGPPKKGPLTIGPELVVEIISNSETAAMLEGKTQDYIEIDVQEMWRVWLETRTVDVVELSAAGAKVLQSYGEGETIVSRVFPDLSVAVSAIFAVPVV